MRLHGGLFANFARWTERQVGRSVTFVVACFIVVLWALTGPIFGFSDTWQLVINTGTTIVTFLMVFVIQNTQSRDTLAIQLKLDELIRVNQDARNSMMNLEEMSEDEIAGVKKAMDDLCNKTEAVRDTIERDSRQTPNTADAR